MINTNHILIAKLDKVKIQHILTYHSSFMISLNKDLDEMSNHPTLVYHFSYEVLNKKLDEYQNHPT